MYGNSIAYKKFWEWHSSFNIETWSVWFRIIVMSVSFFILARKTESPACCCHSLSMYLCSSVVEDTSIDSQTNTMTQNWLTLLLFFFYFCYSVQFNGHAEHFYKQKNEEYVSFADSFNAIFCCRWNTWFSQWVLSANKRTNKQTHTCTHTNHLFLLCLNHFIKQKTKTRTKIE